MTTGRDRAEGPRRLLDRREAIVMLGLGGVGLAALWRTPRQALLAAWRAIAAPVSGEAAQCVLSPEQTAGPFYVANEPVRRDITEGRPGVALRLKLVVRDAVSCRPIPGADVEVWHCDADGVYSGVGGVGGASSFLRGHQTSTRRGKVLFDTIYPGWYPGRTPHVHVKVHVGGTTVHTGQLYFDDAISSEVYGEAPYAARGAASTSNAADGIYASGGAESTLALRLRRRRVQGRITLVVRT
jgi:protocatechuate 3,4-dioxygenase beta subunit